MDRQAALAAYIEAILPEREDWLYGQALRRARTVTRGMTPEERAAYLESRAFGTAL